MTKKRQGRVLKEGWAGPDHPIYQSGYMRLRPIHGSRQESLSDGTTEADEHHDLADSDQEGSET